MSENANTSVAKAINELCIDSANFMPSTGTTLLKTL